MADAEFVAPWIKKADNDIKSARYLANNMRPLPAEIICFHCQQAAEKYLKAYIVYNDQEPPITHDLIELAKLCNNFNGDFSLLSPQCEYLSSFAVRTRYPGTNDPEDEDVKIALAYADRIIELVQSKIPTLFNLTP
jgi:HEPN domain-containing protein